MSNKKFKIKNPLYSIGRFFTQQQHVWVSFSIPFGIMAMVYFIFGVYPVGHRSVLSLDLNAQYVYYFAYMKDALNPFTNESILYAWGRNLSGEFVGIIGYYLFSPFNILVWIFPHSHITEGLLLMILTKLGFIGVTMSVYLRTSRGFSKHTAVLFAVMYALCSYNIVQTMNPMWLDGVMALPLVVMGIEALLKHGKFKLLVFSLVYSFITCFYIGYMIGIFAALYFVYYALTSRRFNAGNVWVLMKRAGMFTLVAVLSVMISAFIILPVYSSLSMGKLDFAENLVDMAAHEEYEIENNFHIIEMTRKLFPNSYDTVRMDGMPFLFVGTIALLTVPAYFFCDRIRRARRIGGAVMILILTLSMYILPVDMFWHGMQVPNWLPYRYSFMLCFLFIKFGAEAFENLRKIPYRVVGFTALSLIALLIYWENVDTVISDLGENGRDVFDWLTVIIPAIGLIILFAAFLILARNRLNKSNSFAVVLIALMSIEMMYNSGLAIRRQHQDIVYSSRDSYNKTMVPTRQVTDRINSEDKTLFRMEKTYIRSANDPMALRMNGVTHSSSMLNERAISILKSLGYSARSHASRYSGNTPLTDDILGFKYTLSCLDNDTSNIHSAGDIIVTENPDVLPLAYLVDPKLLDFNLEGEKCNNGGRNYNDDVFRNQNEMLSYMLGETGNEYFKPLRFEDKRLQNLSYEGMGDGYSGYTRGSEPYDAHIEYDFIASDDGFVYMYFPSIYERRSNLYIHRHFENCREDLLCNEPDYNDFIGQVYETDHHHIQHLGFFKEGEEYMVTLSLEGDKIFFREEWFMRLDTNLLERDVLRLHEMNSGTTFEAVSNRHLKINTSSNEEMLLFTSIPNEPGWTAKINGSDVEIVNVLGELHVWVADGIEHFEYLRGLMAIRVPAGNHQIELKFFPHRMQFGLILTFIGFAGLFIMSFFARLIRSDELEAVLATPSQDELSKDVKDDYDGFDPDYIHIETEEYEDFDFDKIAEIAEKQDSDSL
jgi:uncharacterized membrane protein YfhO